jgi:mycobactin lysine-N-oxygenase
MKNQNSYKHRMIVVGAGPKALALGLRAHVLKEFGFDTPEIYIIEKNEIAAHWTGKHGFTNGQLKLGTSPEKDLGFPYENDGTRQSIKIAQRMQNFSWRSYLMRNNLYSNWVDRGNPQPTHQEWGKYLKFVAEEISSSVHFLSKEVVRAVPKENHWSVLVKDNKSSECSLIRADSLVLTGPTVPKMPPCFPSEKIFNMENFWEKIATIPVESKSKVAVVGNGETAASVLIALSKKRFPNLEIEVISPQGAIFTRGESFLENKFYSTSHQTEWKSMHLEDRRNFIKRTDIGVFSPGAIEELRDEIFKTVAGRVIRVENQLSCDADHVALRIDYRGENRVGRYDYVVFASGLNHSKLIERLLGTEELAKLNAGKSLDEKILEDMSVEGLSPKLYLPMMAGLQQGPGFANLSCLGLLASRILDPLIATSQMVSREDYHETRYSLHSA